MLRQDLKIIKYLKILLKNRTKRKPSCWSICTYSYFILTSLPLHATDIERSDLGQSLDQLQQKMEELRASQDKEPMGVVSFQADQAFELAVQNIRDQEYIAAIRNLNQLLNQMPQIDQERYLKAQFMLGSAYDALHQGARAGKAWLRYLSSYTTQKGDSQIRMLEVVQRLLLVQDNLDSEQKGQFQRSLADMIAMPLSPEIKTEVHLLAGISAIHAGKNRLASSWLEAAQATQTSPRINAEASFYLGLNALAQNDELKAEKIWLELAKDTDETLIMVRDLAALNLGRIYAARKMPKLGLKWYAEVRAAGVISRMANYESALLAAQSEQFVEACRLAKNYIQSYPKTPEAYDLQEKLPLFLYQAGQLDLAEQDLRSRDQNLVELKSWLEKTTRGHLAINSQDLNLVEERTKPYAINSPVMKKSQDLFERLHKLDRLQQEHRNELRSMMLTLGRSVDPHLRPRALANSRQIKTFIEDWVNLGERLVSGERNIYKKYLSPAEQLSLDRSLARRQKIQNIDNEFQKSNWLAWQELSSASVRMGELAQTLQKKNSQLAAIILNVHNSQSAESSAFSRQGKEFQKQVADLQNRSDTLIENLRQKMLAQTAKDSVYLSARKSLLLNAQEFMEAEAIFEAQRKNYDHPLKRHNQEDFELVWTGWKAIAGQMLSQIKEFDHKDKLWIESQIEKFNQLNKKTGDIKIRQLELERRLAHLTGKAWPKILDHMSYHMNEQQSRAKKWLADLEWQRSVNQSQKRQDQKRVQDKQETESQENLKDLELEGALHE
ncbi:MAG: hypothetical protein NTX25_05875 [Proteobacteria bacterium]|nr:hypothetical protein [Pseudomonadota bacterium]